MKDDSSERFLAPDRVIGGQRSTSQSLSVSTQSASVSTVASATLNDSLNDSQWQCQSALESQISIEQQLTWHIQSERVLSEIAQASQKIPGLKGFFQRVVVDVRQLLQIDRVCIYRFHNDWHGDWNSAALAESVQSPFSSMLGIPIRDRFVSGQTALQLYVQGKPYIMSKSLAAVPVLDRSDRSGDPENHECCIDTSTLNVLESFQIQAQLAVPIFRDAELWGLLVAHQCTEPRLWQASEVQFFQHAATQINLAIERAHLRRQIRQLHTNTAFQAQYHANRLRQTLDFEAMLQRITDRVRDSLDENKILQTAVQELTTVLGVASCQAVLCDIGHSSARSRPPIDDDDGAKTGVVGCGGNHEYVTFPANDANWIEVDQLPGLWQQLHGGQYCQFCLMPTVLVQGEKGVLACPIFDDQGYLGNLRLYAQCSHIFDDQEIRLAQQVASHCAIAIRQARLYQAAQTQVRELERLHQLKDDFLSTVSHELRTPLSSIKMVTNLLKLALPQPSVALEQLPDPQTNKVNQYLKVLEDECDREINLVNDLLATQHLDAGNHPLSLTTLCLQDWLPNIAETFNHRVRMNQQRLSFQVDDDLPAVVSDTFMLNRIVVELLNNACKYTPADGEIRISAQWREPAIAHPVQPATLPNSQSRDRSTAAESAYPIQIQVINTGTEIPAEELPRIFDPFYRIPSNDPWKRSGTGLGLSLTKKLVEYLGGKIRVASDAQQVIFTVELPIEEPSGMS